MRTELTAEQVDAYRRDGFLVVPDLLDAEEVERWRSIVGAAVTRRADQQLPPDRREFKADGYYSKVFKQRVNLWQTDPPVAELSLDSRLAALAGTLAGVDGIRLWHDQALIKEAWGNPTALHLDVPYWSFHSTQAISVWVALDDATATNGCLCYLPGSHLTTSDKNVNIGPDLDAVFGHYPELRDVEPVFCPVKAGGAVFHNGLIVHGAGANLTPRPRRAMTVQYMPDGATFNGTQNVLTDEYLATLAIGDRLVNEESNPLLWTRASQSETVRSS